MSGIYVYMLRMGSTSKGKRNELGVERNFFSCSKEVFEIEGFGKFEKGI